MAPKSINNILFVACCLCDARTYKLETTKKGECKHCKGVDTAITYLAQPFKGMEQKK